MNTNESVKERSVKVLVGVNGVTGAAITPSFTQQTAVSLLNYMVLLL